MLKELIKKQENKGLKIFSKKDAHFGQALKFSPEIQAEKISEKVIGIAKKNLIQRGFLQKLD
jgi:hypothetical protein